MNFECCYIYKSKKTIGVVPCKFVPKTDLCDEHLLMRKTFDVKPGYVLLINNEEKLYVTDIRISHTHNDKIKVFFETDAEHREKTITKRKVNISLFISALSLIVSIGALVKSFFY